MIDARGGGFGHHGLGVKGDTETSAFDHRKIVGAIADRQRAGGIEMVFRDCPVQRP